jgi:hypothetical protein
MLSGRNEAFPEAYSSATANGYVSENDAFSFCLANILLRKTIQCCLENLCLLSTSDTGGEVKGLSQAACSMTRLKAEVRVCSGASPRSQLIS